jgi:hypothetical protein
VWTSPAKTIKRRAAVDGCNPVSFPGRPCRSRGEGQFENGDPPDMSLVHPAVLRYLTEIGTARTT